MNQKTAVRSLHLDTNMLVWIMFALSEGKQCETNKNVICMQETKKYLIIDLHTLLLP